MNTPKKDFEVVAREFEEVLSSKLPRGLGGALTRAEKALLKTFFLYLNNSSSSDDYPEPE